MMAGHGNGSGGKKRRGRLQRFCNGGVPPHQFIPQIHEGFAGADSCLQLLHQDCSVVQGIGDGEGAMQLSTGWDIFTERGEGREREMRGECAYMRGR